MNIEEFCGKGGVGKTTSAVSRASYLASLGQKTAIIDFDGGHSVRSTLGIARETAPNKVHRVSASLYVAVIENAEYVSISGFLGSKAKLKEYLAQFPGQLGLIPLMDMVHVFFGILTDVATFQKFAMLVTLLSELENDGFANVVIDVEPTAGLERLLSTAEVTVRSLRNLQKQGVVSLAVLGAKWPHIAAYLKGDYIKGAHTHCVCIERTVAAMKSARYFLVCTPESGPVGQTFETGAIIRSFGGSICGYVVNNSRGEAHEAANIARLEDQGLPIAKIRRQRALHDENVERAPILVSIGEAISSGLVLN